MTSQNHRHNLGAYSLLILAQVMVGINIVSSKYLIAYMPVLFIMTMRFILSGIMLYGIHWIIDPHRNNIRQHLANISKRDWIFIIGQALTAGVLFNFLMILGLNYTTANDAGIITSTLPAFIALMSWIFLKEKFTYKTSLCIGLATLGLVIISLNNVAGTTSHHSHLGNFLVLLSMLPEASYYILSKMCPNRLPVFLVSALLNAINAIVALPLLLLHANWHSIQLTGFDFSILLLISLSSALFFIFWYLASTKVNGIMASLSTAVMPIATVIIACLALNERIFPTQIAGMCLVISSILVYALPKRNKPLQAYSQE
jgi:drug/metabolite transporter (DMT)-like permease